MQCHQNRFKDFRKYQTLNPPYISFTNIGKCLQTPGTHLSYFLKLQKLALCIRVLTTFAYIRQ